jgi:hypothetical protein
MEAAHTLNNEILKERKGMEGREEEEEEDSGEESEDSCAQDRKPNLLHHQHDNKDDLRQGMLTRICFPSVRIISRKFCLTLCDSSSIENVIFC